MRSKQIKSLSSASSAAWPLRSLFFRAHSSSPNDTFFISLPDYCCRRCRHESSHSILFSSFLSVFFASRCNSACRSRRRGRGTWRHEGRSTPWIPWDTGSRAPIKAGIDVWRSRRTEAVSVKVSVSVCARYFFSVCFCYHLKGRQVFLPPNVFLIFRTHRGDHIVEVHDNVHKGIQHREERAVTARRKLHSHPDWKIVMKMKTNSWAWSHRNSPLNGMTPWCITWSVETCWFFFRSKKKSVSKNSVNFEM